MLNSSNHLLKLHGIDFLSERIYTQIILDSIILKLYITYIHTGGVSNDTRGIKRYTKLVSWPPYLYRYPHSRGIKRYTKLIFWPPYL